MLIFWLLVILCVILNAFYFGFVYARRIKDDLEMPLPDKRHLYCIGDGLTYGVGVLRERRAFAWPYLLNVHLGAQWQVLNYGVKDAVIRAAGKSCLTKSRQFEHFRKQTDATVILMIGTNDSKLGEWHAMQFEDDFKALLRSVLSVTDQCLVLLPPAVQQAKNGQKTDIRAKIVDEIVEIERACALKMGLLLIDIRDYTKNHPEWYCDDGVHLNRAGNLALADELNAVFLPALLSR